MGRNVWTAHSYEWDKCFEYDRMSVDDDPKPGQTSTSTDDDYVERVCAAINGNCLTVREVVNKVGINIYHAIKLCIFKLMSC